MDGTAVAGRAADDATAQPAKALDGMPTMGYQPSLDGLRAVSVAVVLLYHAGFSWMRGGFFGVEVFFVVSGFLITSLLLDEHDRTDGIAYGQFWLRRIRRLFPALYGVLLAVAVWAALAGSAAQQSQLRREIPWSIFYVNNWGQILGGVPYFSGEQSLLRHLWSLAVEEQWYLIWPLAFAALMRLRLARHVVGGLVVGAALVVFIYTFWMQTRAPTALGGPPEAFVGVNRTNYLYLSTVTRVGGLLLGAGTAFIWRPWRWAHARDAAAGRLLDPLGGAAVAALGCAAVVAQLTAGYVYQWLLSLVSILSLIAVMVAVHPAALGFRRVMGWLPLVEVGKRSYGLYLWSWPIFVIVGATDGSVLSFVVAMLITVVVSEASYQYLETPVRRGVVGRWWKNRAPITYMPVAGGALLVGCLAIFYASVGQFSFFEGGDDAVFELVDPVPTTLEAESTEVSIPDDTTIQTTSTTAVVAPSLRLAIVGDSQANALAVNLPDGIGEVFPQVVNGSLDGCSVYDSGQVRSAVNFTNSFAVCEGWQQDWAEAASHSDVALVVIGAWDVFDIRDGDTTYAFDTDIADRHFATNLISGIDAMLAKGAGVGLLEVPCMRPQDVDSAGIRALPERGDDARVAHLNDLMRWVSSQYGPEVRVIDGPDEWCNDEAIATDLSYRWDGVHVYEPGANLIYTTIAPDLLDLAT